MTKTNHAKRTQNGNTFPPFPETPCSLKIALPCTCETRGVKLRNMTEMKKGGKKRMKKADGRHTKDMQARVCQRYDPSVVSRCRRLCPSVFCVCLRLQHHLDTSFHWPGRRDACRCRGRIYLWRHRRTGYQVQVAVGLVRQKANGQFKATRARHVDWSTMQGTWQTTSSGPGEGPSVGAGLTPTVTGKTRLMKVLPVASLNKTS